MAKLEEVAEEAVTWVGMDPQQIPGATYQTITRVSLTQIVEKLTDEELTH